MTTLSEIQDAILDLRQPELLELKQWLAGLDEDGQWQQWDEQIEADSSAGKLDVLVAQAQQAKADGTLAEL